MVERDDWPERISARVSTKVRQRIEELAAADQAPVSQVVRRIVTRAVERDDQGAAA